MQNRGNMLYILNNNESLKLGNQHDELINRIKNTLRYKELENIRKSLKNYTTCTNMCINLINTTSGRNLRRWDKIYFHNIT